MDNSLGKGIATAGVWIALASMTATMDTLAFFGYAIMLILAVIATGMIWSFGSDEHHPDAAAQAEKAKRAGGDSIGLLLDLLDDDELAAFKAALQQRVLDHVGETPTDGEQSLADLLREDRPRASRR